MTGREGTSGWERRRKILLNQYERVALELFARHGYPNVTVEDIAAEAGISIRTTYRYFPTKEECLLGYPRRGIEAEIAAVSDLEPDSDPLTAAWQVIRDFFLVSPVETDVLTLWLAAAEGAPEVLDRVRGARSSALTDALITYCERSLGVDASADARPRLIAGVLSGIEAALIEAATRAPAIFGEIVAASESAVEAVRRTALSVDVGTRLSEG